MLAMKGKQPKIRLISLYLPVRCIIHPANIDPQDMETKKKETVSNTREERSELAVPEFGIKCNPNDDK